MPIHISSMLASLLILRWVAYSLIPAADLTCAHRGNQELIRRYTLPIPSPVLSSSERFTLSRLVPTLVSQHKPFTTRLSRLIRYADAIVQNFLNSVNYHYYIIYPASFLTDYEAWWNDRNAQRPLEAQWTCLLLMICACSVQYTSPELEPKLADLDEDTQRLCERYHNVARELHSVIPVGHNHIYNVQSLLHSCYWYKSEARFVECWHVLSSAIREAQELGE